MLPNPYRFVQSFEWGQCLLSHRLFVFLPPSLVPSAHLMPLCGSLSPRLRRSKCQDHSIQLTIAATLEFIHSFFLQSELCFLFVFFCLRYHSRIQLVAMCQLCRPHCGLIPLDFVLQAPVSRIAVTCTVRTSLWTGLPAGKQCALGIFQSWASDVSPGYASFVKPHLSLDASITFSPVFGFL